MLEIGLPALPGVPSRAILLWPLAFNPALYPQLTGYVLCNGLNGTPDIRNRTPRGTPIAAVVLAVGGAAAHDHGAGTYAAAAHAHTVANHQHTVPDHSHSVPDHNHEVPAHCHDTVSHCHATNVTAVGVCPVGAALPVVDFVSDPTDGCTVVVNERAAFCTDTESGVSTGTESGVSTGNTAPGTDAVGAAVAGTSAACGALPPWMNLNFIMRL